MAQRAGRCGSALHGTVRPVVTGRCGSHPPTPRHHRATDVGFVVSRTLDFSRDTPHDSTHPYTTFDHSSEFAARAGNGSSPACAGNTRNGGGLQPTDRHQAPRARGTLSHRVHVVVTSRISPACGGNTHCSSVKLHFNPDQPRVRGEHPGGVPDEATLAGSAPRARGTLSHPLGPTLVTRISPACAGNTAAPDCTA